MGINLKPFKTIRIAISHDVFLNKLETLIIDTPEFQRLRRLRQLGSSDLVFPTALHNRFVHSLGTLHIANKMIRCIRENRHNEGKESDITKEQEQLVRLVALLHDIGHLPYGHTIEDEFNIFPRHDEDQERINILIGRESNIGKILRNDKDGIGDDLFNKLFNILTTTKESLHLLGSDLFIYDIVNNTVCADLLDYLQRDSYFCDLPEGLDYRFLNYLYLFEDVIKVKVENNQHINNNFPNEELFSSDTEIYENKAENGLKQEKRQLVIEKEFKVKRTAIRLSNKKGDKPRPDLLNELVQLLEYRYKLGEIVYFHHAKLASGSMIAGAVYRAKKEGSISLKDLYGMGDEKLIYTLQEKGSKSVKKLIDSFELRNLWKASSFQKTREKIEAEQYEISDTDIIERIEDEFYIDSDNRYNVEKDLCDRYGFEDGDVLIHCPKNTMQMKLAQMNVFWQGKHQPLEKCKHNELTDRKLKNILDSHKKLWAFRIFINPKIKDKDEAIKIYFNNVLCFSKTKKKSKEKAAINDFAIYELKLNYDVEKLTVSKFDKVIETISSSALVDTFGEHNAENLRILVNQISKKNGVSKKSKSEEI